jgi:translation initiation factor IF-3
MSLESFMERLGIELGSRGPALLEDLSIAKAPKRVRRNDEITAQQERVIGPDREHARVMTRAQALQLAQDAALDLVEVSPTAEPPVVRVMDFGKYLFEQNKKAHSAKRKQKQIQVKEVKFRPGTEEADYQVKLRNLIRFLTEGDKAKVTLRFRGREMAHQDIGRRLLQRVSADLAEIAVIEQNPLMEGRQMVMVFSPKKK